MVWTPLRVLLLSAKVEWGRRGVLIIFRWNAHLLFRRKSTIPTSTIFTSLRHSLWASWCSCCLLNSIFCFFRASCSSDSFLRINRHQHLISYPVELDLRTLQAPGIPQLACNHLFVTHLRHLMPPNGPMQDIIVVLCFRYCPRANSTRRSACLHNTHRCLDNTLTLCRADSFQCLTC